eukprot:m.96052 g.96052  ORF g.96052 m.96052 type:complete len:533 (-) comp12348_c0_seq3:28-1626(-)
MNEAARVALAIVKEHFGEACRLVFATLVARESTLKQVAEGSGLPLAQARESLTWLLQHDVITFTAQPQKSFSDKPGPNVYRTIVWRVLQRARIPRMLHYTAKNHGDLEESIVQVIALQGRVRLKGIIAAIRTENAEVEASTIKGTVEALLTSRLIHGRDGNDDPDACPLTESSFSMDAPWPAWTSSGAGDNETSGSKRRLSSSSSPLSSASKRARRDSMASTDLPDSPTKPPSERYFTLNYRQYQRCLFSEWAVGYIAKAVDPVCGEVLRALFDAVLLGDPFAGERSRCITKDEVWNGLSPGRFSDAELSDHLQTLLTFGSGFVTESGGIDRLHLEFKVMRDLAQYLAIEKMVELKCGDECARLFRLVRTKRYIEQKKVKDVALMGAFKDTKVSLNKLFKNDFLMMREIPKQADRVPSKCVYVWTCDMNRVSTMVLHQCYKAQANLATRLAVERKAYKVLKAKQEKQANPSEHADQQRAKADKEALEQIVAKLEKLERATLEIDEQVMLVRDFDEMAPARRHENLLPPPVKK